MNLKAGFVISYVVDFLLIVQWIAVLISWRKQKKSIACFALFITIIYGQEFSSVIPAVALRKSQPLELRSVFYSLAKRLSMFRAKLNTFESILSVWNFLRYQYVATVAFTSKGFAPKPPFLRYRQIYSCRVKPLLLSNFLVMPLIKNI